MNAMNALLILQIHLLTYFIENAFGFHIKTILRSERLSSNLQMTSFTSKYLEQLNNEFSLKMTAYSEPSWTTELGATGSSDWWDETKGSKFTGVSKYSYSLPNHSSSVESLSIWMGPSLLTPHMTMSIEEIGQSGRCNVMMDYIPRGGQPLGSESNFFTKYYNDLELLNSYAQYHLPSHSTGRVPYAHNSIFGRMIQSPMMVSISGVSVADAAQMTSQHLQRFIQWVNAAALVEPRQRAVVNTRDDKLRQFAFQANLQAVADAGITCDMDMARMIAASWTGPIAEAYIGGGS